MAANLGMGNSTCEPMEGGVLVRHDHLEFHALKWITK